MLWIGLYPKPFFDILERPVSYVVEKVDAGYMDRDPLKYPEPQPAVHEEETHVAELNPEVVE